MPNAAREGTPYISLDGQHRALCISEFVNNSRTYTGEITDDDGNSMWVKNRFFKDLEKSYRDHFMNQNVVVQRFERVLRDELPKIFKGLNSNSGLTDQHQRNACQTPFAQWTREVASQHKHMFEAILAPKSFEKMQPHQFISKLFMHIDDPMSSVGKKALDDFYEKGEGDYSFANKYSEDVKNKVQKILRTLRHIYQTLQKQKISNNNLLTLSLVLDKWYSKGLDPQEPIDGDRFVETVTNADLALLFKSKQQEVDDQKKKRY